MLVAELIERLAEFHPLDNITTQDGDDLLSVDRVDGEPVLVTDRPIAQLGDCVEIVMRGGI